MIGDLVLFGVKITIVSIETRGKELHGKIREKAS
jgi:hypothetical protein